MRYWETLLCALFVVFLTSATTWGQAADSDGIYHLQPGDGIEIRFFFNPEMNDTAIIRPDGRIAMPLIGEIVVAGRTIADVSRDLEQRFAGELKNPRVTIAVRTYSSQRVFVGGEVNRAGTVVLAGNLTVIDAIMDAGGIRRTGDLSRVILVRKSRADAPEKRILNLQVDKTPLPQHLDLALNLQPFDLILVPETKLARVDRWVDQAIRQLIPANLNAGFSYLFNPIAIR